MKGQPAKVLGGKEVAWALTAGQRRRHPRRSTVMILLSVKAGLRACEISRLTWPMVSDARGRVGTILELPAKAAKKGSGRRIPIHPDLRAALERLGCHGVPAKTKGEVCLGEDQIEVSGTQHAGVTELGAGGRSPRAVALATAVLC